MSQIGLWKHNIKPCRSRVNHEFKDENGNYKQHSRFNYGVVTNNIVRLALETIKQNGDENLFFKLLEEKYSLIKLALESKYKNVKKMKAKDAPILFMYGGICRLKPEDSIEHLLKSDQASLSYGWFGLDDTVRLLTNNEENISTEKGSEFGNKIIKALREQADRIKNETKLPVSLYSSPLEAGVHTFFVGDKVLYGDIMPKWLLDREYYTNSFHFSSEVPIDSFDKIKVESKFVPYNNGGNISYVENGGKVYNYKTIIELIQYAYECKTEYFACNTISDVCYECGYMGEIKYNEMEHNYTCPNCGNSDGSKQKIQRRSCGYISNYNITHAKSGRMKEIKNRAKHFNK